MIEDYPSYIYTEVDFKLIQNELKIKWPLIFKITLEPESCPVQLEVFISTQYMLPSPTKCEKVIEIEAMPDQPSLFYFGTNSDMDILKENS